MNKAISGKEILEKLHRKEKRKPCTFYLSADVAERLKVVCEEQHVTGSSVVEELVRGFLESLGR